MIRIVAALILTVLVGGLVSGIDLAVYVDEDAFVTLAGHSLVSAPSILLLSILRSNRPRLS